MTPLTWFALVGFGLTALSDHWAVATRSKPFEYLAKPLTMVWLGLFVLALDPLRADAVAWWVAAIVLSLAGDVFLMLPRDLFVFGLGSFLFAHLAYVGGFVSVGLESPVWLPLVVLVPVAGVLLATMMRGPGMKPALRLPVTAYVGVIVVMVTCAWASGSWVAGLGATSFMASDALIGWRRFVQDQRWMAVAIIVLYHLGQLGLALYLLI
ncbi:MAG: lysoplasmalogenase [Actinomycetota bacterium]